MNQAHVNADKPGGWAYVIAARNAGRTIGQTLASVRGQSQGGWTTIVVDDGSTDETADVVARIVADDPRIRLLRRPASGVAAARQAGFEASGAEIVCFLDADDLATPDQLATLSAALGNNEGVAGGFELVDTDGSPLGHQQLPNAGDEGLEPQLLCTRLVIGTVALRRGVLERIISRYGTLFDGQSRCEDAEFWLRVARVGARWAEPARRVVLQYRQGAGTRSAAVEQAYTDWLAAIDRHAPGPAVRQDARRRAGLRLIARGVVRRDRGLVNRGLADIGGIQPRDEGTLASSIRWCLIVEERGAFRDGRVGIAEVERRIGAVLPEAADAWGLAGKSVMDERAWARAAATALQRLDPGEVLVLYGMGKNGRSALAGIGERDRAKVAFVDDREHVEAGGIKRVTMGDLERRHVVLVTPDEREGILRKLGAAGVRRVVMAEDLLLGA